MNSEENSLGVMETRMKIISAFAKAKWPGEGFTKELRRKRCINLSNGEGVIDLEEDEFNKFVLPDYLKSLPGFMKLNVEVRSKKIPGLFGCDVNPNDVYCELNNLSFYVENKIIRPSKGQPPQDKRWEIHNSLAQGVTYMSAGFTNLIVLLIFDTCISVSPEKEKEIEKDWGISTPECRFIHTITKEYGDLCVVRVRKKENTSQSDNENKNDSQNIDYAKLYKLMDPAIVELFYQSSYIRMENI